MKPGKFFLLLFLAISNVVWFYNTSLGLLKIALTILLITANYKIFINRDSYYKFPIFIYVIFSIIVSLYIHPNIKGFEAIYYIYGFVENYLFFLLGYNYMKKDMLNEKDLTYLLYAIIPLSIIIIINFITGWPEWYSPSEYINLKEFKEMGYAGHYSLSPLYSTGFGIARTGWANSLCLFLPLTFLFKRRVTKTITFFLILTCVFLSASRGGMTCALIIILTSVIIYIKDLRWKALMVFILIALSIFLYLKGNELLLFLRIIGNEDITTGRLSQLSNLPLLFKNYSISGIGINGIAPIFLQHGIYHTLHNTYLRLPLELGLLFTISFVFIIIKIFRIITTFIHSGEYNEKIFLLTIISGLTSCFFEPQAVFGSTNWYSIWWFLLGILSCSKKELAASSCY